MSVTVAADVVSIFKYAANNGFSVQSESRTRLCNGRFALHTRRRCQSSGDSALAMALPDTLMYLSPSEEMLHALIVWPCLYSCLPSARCIYTFLVCAPFLGCLTDTLSVFSYDLISLSSQINTQCLFQSQFTSRNILEFRAGESYL